MKKEYKIEQLPEMDHIIINGIKYVKEACGIETEPETKKISVSQEKGVKKPEFVITKEQILNLCQPSLYTNKERLQELFPSAFEPVSEVGKWYFYNKNAVCIYFVTKIEEHNVFAYGINYEGRWRSEELWYNTNDSDDSCLRLATESEVFEALKAEAVKRYTVGDYVKGLYGDSVLELTFEPTMIRDHESEIIFVDSYFQVWMSIGNKTNRKVFENGQWAEIIPTITKEQAEKELNKKIIG